MENTYLFFQADQWKRYAPSGSSEMEWESGQYPNGEQWAKIEFPPELLPQVTVVAAFHDEEALDKQLMRLFLLLEVARRAAKELRLIMPYMPYSLQDRDVHGGDAAAAHVVMRLIEASSVDHVTVFDWHNPQLEEAWDLEVDDRRAAPLLAEAVLRKFRPEELAVIAPDDGAEERAKEFAQLLGSQFIKLEKVRLGPGRVEVTGDVHTCPARHFLLYDDMINTGSTIAESAQLLREQCQVDVSVAVTHGLFAGRAVAWLKESGVSQVFVTDSYLSEPIRNGESILQVADIGSLLFG